MIVINKDTGEQREYGEVAVGVLRELGELGVFDGAAASENMDNLTVPNDIFVLLDNIVGIDVENFKKMSELGKTLELSEITRLMSKYRIQSNDYKERHAAFEGLFAEVETNKIEEKPRKARKKPLADADKDTVCVQEIDRLVKNADGAKTLSAILRTYGKERVRRVFENGAASRDSSALDYDGGKFAELWGNSLYIYTSQDDKFKPETADLAEFGGVLREYAKSLGGVISYQPQGKMPVDTSPLYQEFEPTVLEKYPENGKRRVIFAHDNKTYAGRLSRLFRKIGEGEFINDGKVFKTDAPESFYDNSDNSAVLLAEDDGGELCAAAAAGDMGDLSSLTKYKNLTKKLAKTREKAKVTDSGEKIYGARKEDEDIQKRKDKINKARTQAISALQDNLSNEEIEKLIHKDAIWSVPNYANLVADGLAPIVAYYIKFIRDKTIIKLPSESNTPTREAALNYIEFVENLQDDIELHLKTPEDIVNYWVSFLLRGEYIIEDGEKGENHYTYTEKARGYLAFGGKWKSFVWGEQTLAYKQIEVDYLNFPEHTVITPSGLRFAWITDADGSPALAGAKLVESIAGRDYAVLGTAKSARELYEVLNGKKRPNIYKIRKTTPNMRPLGDDGSPVDIASSYEIREVFGFRSVEFGNYVPQKERKMFLNAAFNGCMDISALTKFLPKDISLSHEKPHITALGLAYGSRGTGNLGGRGKYTAMYYPKLYLLALTRTAGIGAMAHEWGHGLDYFVSELCGISHNDLETIEQPKDEKKTALAKAWREIHRVFKYNQNGYDTEFYTHAKLLDQKRAKGYWSKPTELFARAFEAYTEDNLGGVNTLLTEDNTHTFGKFRRKATKKRAAAEFEVSAFPINQEERERINTAFDALLSEVRKVCELTEFDKEKIETLREAYKLPENTEESPKETPMNTETEQEPSDPEKDMVKEVREKGERLVVVARGILEISRKYHKTNLFMASLAITDAVAEFGAEDVRTVLAMTAVRSWDDARIEIKNKKWASRVAPPLWRLGDRQNSSYRDRVSAALSSLHCTLVNMLIDRFRESEFDYDTTPEQNADELYRELNYALRQFSLWQDKDCGVLDVYVSGDGISLQFDANNWEVLRRSLVADPSKRLTSTAIIAGLRETYPNNVFTLLDFAFARYEGENGLPLDFAAKFMVGFDNTYEFQMIAVSVVPSFTEDLSVYDPKEQDPREAAFSEDKRVLFELLKHEAGRVLNPENEGITGIANLSDKYFYRTSENDPNGENACRTAVFADFVKYRLLPDNSDEDNFTKEDDESNALDAPSIYDAPPAVNVGASFNQSVRENLESIISELNVFFEGLEFKGFSGGRSEKGCYVLDIFEYTSSKETGNSVKSAKQRSIIANESKRLTSFAAAHALSREYKNERFIIKKKQFVGNPVNSGFVVGLISSGDKSRRIMVVGSSSKDTASGFYAFSKNLFGADNIDSSTVKRKKAYYYYRTTENNPNGENALRPATSEDFLQYKLTAKDGRIYD